MAVNDFDRITPFYDRLAKLVFGDKLIKAQVHFMNLVQPQHRVLIIGGGTGHLLEEISLCDRIDYVEKSEAMLRRAAKRKANHSINFHHTDFLEFEPETEFDFVICPFFLDCFKEERLKIVLEKIKSVLAPDGTLVVTDFQKTNGNSLLLKLMHTFFKFTTHLESNTLSDIHTAVISSRFECINEIFLHRNQLFSRLYRNL